MRSRRARRRSLDGTPTGAFECGSALPTHTRGSGVTALTHASRWTWSLRALTEMYSGLRMADDVRFHTSLPGRPLFRKPCLRRKPSILSTERSGFLLGRSVTYFAIAWILARGRSSAAASVSQVEGEGASAAFRWRRRDRGACGSRAAARQPPTTAA